MKKDVRNLKKVSKIVGNVDLQTLCGRDRVEP